jgi:hypothetical protein
MGGIGSGRYYRYSGKIQFEETKRIDIRYLRKRNFLKPNLHGTLSWTVRGEPCGTINFQYTHEQLMLSYRVRDTGGEWEPIKQNIKLTQTPCNYGGKRTWFICPSCNKRKAVLCLHDTLFYCRKCCNYPYSSQCEGKLDNLISKRDKIAKRIFDETGCRKKKWMHEKVFQAELDKYLHLDNYIEDQIYQRLTSL